MKKCMIALFILFSISMAMLVSCSNAAQSSVYKPEECMKKTADTICKMANNKEYCKIKELSSQDQIIIDSVSSQMQNPPKSVYEIEFDKNSDFFTGFNAGEEESMSEMLQRQTDLMLYPWISQDIDYEYMPDGYVPLGTIFSLYDHYKCDSEKDRCRIFVWDDVSIITFCMRSADGVTTVAGCINFTICEKNYSTGNDLAELFENGIYQWSIRCKVTKVD